MRALIIDDERLARAELRRLLSAHPEVEIVGEARNGPEAIDLIGRLRPELLFLDIQMPGMTGFDVLERLEDPPQVIFTTAYDQHAVQAFEANATDYLMKPVAPSRLAAALKKLRPSSPGPRLDRVFVRDGDRCWLVQLSDIVLMTSEGNYTRLHFGVEKPLIPRSLAQLEERLDPAVFFRASRQHIVNLRAIEQIDPGVADNLIVSIKGGQRIEMSRRQSAKLREILSL